ncbi:hypothetical protein AQUCO_01900064v1 [Aquilegia coerulea]|uniref:Cytochrome P450 n=1 Tax=Aquilegia coerulea TaxID=218851 RepID=A0A2G5DIS3_AQUCA|nr:hypothetical protein AQUCO_01900064v1 [Aquilegia coerulea]
MEIITDFKMIFFALFLISFSTLFLYFYVKLWLNPRRIRKKLRTQGINGPEPSFLYGNLPDIKKIQISTALKIDGKDSVNVLDNYLSVVHPYIEQWRRQYGDIFMYSTGHRVHLCVSCPEIVKDICLQKLELGKPSYIFQELSPIFGNGIIGSNGQWWAKQKKIIAPEFFMEKVKSWENQIASNGGVADIKVDDDLRDLSADVISRACFGSSYGMGNEIFKTLGALKEIITRKNYIFGIPSFSYLPTKMNREIWKLEKKVKSSVLKIIKQRTKDPMSSKDLLMTILKNANSGQLPPGASNQFIVDNCKNFYFAGHDTTATAVRWILVLLASYPEWQMHARAEVVEVCGDKLPNADSIGKMKMLTMVIKECLRLYPPSVFVARETMEELKLGNLKIPKGTHVWVPIPAMHRDTRIWGQDVNEFRPERFKNGISGACNFPIAYMPFGMGPRTCLGQHLAMVELKIILSLILLKFSFSLSPKYKHFPQTRMLVEPGYGVYLLIKKI